MGDRMSLIYSTHKALLCSCLVEQDIAVFVAYVQEIVEKNLLLFEGNCTHFTGFGSRKTDPESHSPFPIRHNIYAPDEGPF